ncbi:MAG: NUDIX domain-containing protein [Bowdeniella nasicola]|nr:NUDIX domain-containing protein [Bowdeniella nasicola]
MTFGAILTVIAALALAVMLVRAITLARRLDRLHKALIACRHELDAQLVHRAVAAQQLGTCGVLDPATSLVLTDAADASLGLAGYLVADGLERRDFTHRHIEPDQRARIESTLTAVLTQICERSEREDLEAIPAWREATDAWYRADLARTFHDSRREAVMRVRSGVLTRLFRLAGSAPEPATFDATLTLPAHINPELTPAVPPEGLAPSDSSAARAFRDEYDVGPSGYPERQAARVLLIDRDGRVLMVRGHDIQDPDHWWWFTPGGGLNCGEDPADGARRELYEETGISLARSDLEGPVARRSAEFRFTGATLVQHEVFYVAHVADAAPSTSSACLTDLEEQVLDEFAWFTAKELSDKAEAGEKVYPEALPQLLMRLVREGWDGDVVVV